MGRSPAERTSHVNTTSPSKTTVKAWILGEQTASVLQQTTRNTIRCTATVNIESCIKFTDFSQRFAVLLAQRLQIRSASRLLRLETLEATFRHSADTMKRQSGQPNNTTVEKQAVYNVQSLFHQQKSQSPHRRFVDTTSTFKDCRKTLLAKCPSFWKAPVELD